MKILFQGDSVTDAGREGGLLQPNRGLGLGYPIFVAGQLLSRYPDKGFEIINRGVSGNRVVDLYARWKIDALNLKPDVISILIGVNDTWHEFGNGNGVEVDRYEMVYHELLSWTKKVLPDVRLVLCEPFVLPFGAVGEKWIDEMNSRRAIVKALASEFGAVFAPFQSVLNDACGRAPQEHWLADGVHPTTAGHALLADAWVEAAAPVLGI